MAYFNYHAKIQTKIKNGELTSYHFDQNYPQIGFALVLCFGNKKYPVREHAFAEYFDLIGNIYSTTKCGNEYITTPINYEMT